MPWPKGSSCFDGSLAIEYPGRYEIDKVMPSIVAALVGLSPVGVVNAAAPTPAAVPPAVPSAVVPSSPAADTAKPARTCQNSQETQ